MKPGFEFFETGLFFKIRASYQAEGFTSAA